MTGFIQDDKYVGRPVDIEWLKDGSMLLSDDYNGAVYHVTYGPPRQVSMRHWAGKWRVSAAPHHFLRYSWPVRSLLLLPSLKRD